MTQAARLAARVLLYNALFSAGTAALVGILSPALLLLQGRAQHSAMLALFAAVCAAGLISLGYARWVLRRHRFLLRSLALGSTALEAREVAELAEEPWSLTLGWLIPNLLALAGLGWFGPVEIDRITAINLSLLGMVIAAAASLPFYVLVRSEICDVLELTPRELMREVLDRAERTRLPAQKVSRRILAAVATPVLFLALGSALITNAHLRRADETEREQTARVFARAVLDVGPGVLTSGGLQEALARGTELGFRAHLSTDGGGYRLQRDEADLVDLVVPLERHAVAVRFRATSGTVLRTELVVVSLLAVAIAALIGVLLGRALTRDLRTATREVHLLGTDVVLSGSQLVTQPRFRAVAALLDAVAQLAARFRVFAEAQVRAIEAREAATRMRGQFFASVSHDLRSPLNAILGFSELVRQNEPLTPGQLESLTLIEHRGRELLALVETILDAARVEAGHLKLLRDRVIIGELLGAAIIKGQDLGGEHNVEAVAEFPANVPAVSVDRLRMGRALATFIGHALRTAERPVLRVRATLASERRVAIEVEIPSRRFSARQLEAMLNPSRQPGSSPHRGLALALGLARSMVELHGGIVRVEDRATEGAAFIILLPVG
jgi:signal transduction histidine kinase